MVENVLKNVQMIRESRNKSQEQMAEMMQITQSKYARFESGKSKTDLNMIVRFAKALDMEPLDVITYPHRYVSASDLVVTTDKIEAVLQVRLVKEKREQVLRLVFGDEGVEYLNTP